VKEKFGLAIVLMVLIVSCGDGSNISLGKNGLPSLPEAIEIKDAMDSKEKISIVNTFGEDQKLWWGYYTDNFYRRWYISLAIAEDIKWDVYSLMKIKTFETEPLIRAGWGTVAKEVAKTDLIRHRIAIDSGLLINNPSDTYYDVGWLEEVTNPRILSDRELIQGQTVSIKWWFFQNTKDNLWYIINSPKYDDGIRNGWDTETGNGLQILKFGHKDGQYEWIPSVTTNLIASFYNGQASGWSIKKLDVSMVGDRFTNPNQPSGMDEPSGSEIDVKKDKAEIQKISDPRQWMIGANISTLKQEMKDVISTVIRIWKENNLGTPLITSGNDGKHSHNSLHYTDFAIDLRTTGFNPEIDRREISGILKVAIKVALGEKEYCIKFEPTEKNATGEIVKTEHIHIQFGYDNSCSF